MKNRFKVMVLFLLFQVSVFADTASEIKDVNNKVLQIEKIKQGLNVLELKLQTGEMEAVPPQVKFYYKAENLELVLTQVSAGHEVFSINYSYYYDKK